MWINTQNDLSGNIAVLDLEALYKTARIAYFGRLYKIDGIISKLKNLDQFKNEEEVRENGISRDMLAQELDSSTADLVIASETLHVLSEARKTRRNIKILNHNVKEEK